MEIEAMVNCKTSPAEMADVHPVRVELWPLVLPDEIVGGAEPDMVVMVPG